MLYFSPPLEAVDHVQLIRGGSALLYGPQPGPALNLVTHLPPSDRAFTARTQHSAGSYGLFSTYNEISGTVEDLGYLALFHHRQADGPRDNADYYVYSGNFKLVLDPNEHTRWIIALDAYSNENGEPGRMNLATYLANRNTATTPSNRLWVQRYMPSVTYQHNVSEDTLLEIKSWAGYQGRLSRRQTGANTNLDHHQIYFGGLDTRVRHYWSGWEDGQVFTGGFVLYGANRPRPREACADRHVR
jgi:Fe(3+) dicitrate transport protein